MFPRSPSVVQLFALITLSCCCLASVGCETAKASYISKAEAAIAIHSLQQATPIPHVIPDQSSLAPLPSLDENLGGARLPGESEPASLPLTNINSSTGNLSITDLKLSNYQQAGWTEGLTLPSREETPPLTTYEAPKIVYIQCGPAGCSPPQQNYGGYQANTGPRFNGPIARGGRRIGWRITHPFGGRFRRN